ncbi:MAG TPA: VacJ family lipoprotein [Aliidongia sp.]|nr:VacJ family lipoprotein [Aliidongia sp.]
MVPRISSSARQRSAGADAFETTRWKRTIMALTVGLTLIQAGCASPAKPATEAQSEAETNDDPFEPANRVVFDANQQLDRYLVRPIAWAYREAVPDPFRLGISNILNNLNSPAVLMNDPLQGNLRCAGETITRIAANSVFGIGGFFDVGERMGVPRHSADFGQTLGSWGVDRGPFLYVPLLGPIYTRDAGGYIIDSAADPFAIEMQLAHIDAANYARFGMTPVDFRARKMATLDNLERDSFDLYAVQRSIAAQSRMAAIARADTPSSAESCSLGAGLKSN